MSRLEKMGTSGAEWWELFRDAFHEQGSTISAMELSSAWQSAAERTRLYSQVWFPRIAARLHLKLQREFCGIDFIFSRKADNGTWIPQIAVESENNPDTAQHELKKLCLLAAPLRILLTAVDRTTGPRVWQGRSDYAERLVMSWNPIVHAHRELTVPESKLKVVVGEKLLGAQLVFYSLDFTPGALEVDYLEELELERDLSATAIMSELQQRIRDESGD